MSRSSGSIHPLALWTYCASRWSTYLYNTPLHLGSQRISICKLSRTRLYSKVPSSPTMNLSLRRTHDTFSLKGLILESWPFKMFSRYGLVVQTTGYVCELEPFIASKESNKEFFFSRWFRALLNP